MTTKNRKYNIISTDGHTIEPPGMWERHLPKKYHAQAPRVVKDPEGGDAWELVPGQPVMPIGLVVNRGEWGRRYEDNNWFGTTFENMRQGAFDGKARLEEQDIDGVDAEVLYPSQRTMAAFMAQPDDDYHLAGVDAYNAWLFEEFAAADPTRLIGLYPNPGCRYPKLAHPRQGSEGSRRQRGHHLGSSLRQHQADRCRGPILGIVRGT